MTAQEIREREIEYCLDNVVYFVRTYGHIEDKDAAELIQPFDMWPEQEEALLSIHEHRLNAILKARQLGFSWLVINYSALYLLNSGRTIIALSRSEEEAKELIRRMSVVLKNMPEFFYEEKEAPAGWTGMTFKANAMDLVVHYPDGRPDSIMKGFPSSPSAARSFTADLLIFDEWAFQQFAREIWTSAFPVINRPNGGKVIGLSTIDRGSLFEEIFTDPDNGFNKIFIPWYADPRRDAEWYENTKRALGDLITQEYPATIEEALTVPGGAYFPEVRKDTHITKADYIQGSVRRYVCIDYGLDMLSVHWIKVDTKNNAQVYREYDSPDKTIGAACDIMIDLTGDEKIELWLAPPDLWNRSQESGKSRAQLFADGGINLTKTSNDFPAGCSGMKEWLKPQSNGKAKLTFEEDAAPNLFRNLQKIQRDKKRPNVYAKEPHDLTHACLTGDTLVKTTEGYKRIDSLVGKEGDVYCIDENKNITIKHFDSVCMTRKNAEIYEVELKDGTIIKATGDHKVMTNSGWKEIMNLDDEDEVLQFSFDFEKCLHKRVRKLLYENICKLKKFFHKLGKHEGLY